jgi:hypothetical protein
MWWNTFLLWFSWCMEFSDRMNWWGQERQTYSFQYSFILIIGYIRTCFHLLYHQTEGIAKVTGKNLPSHLSYSYMCKRINRLNVILKKVRQMNNIVISVFGKDIKVTNRSMDTWQMEKKQGWKERLFKNPCWSRHKDQRNSCFRSYGWEYTW